MRFSARLLPAAMVGLLAVTVVASRAAPTSLSATAPESTSASVAVDVLTQHNNPERSGANLNETILTPKEVQSGRFGRLFHWDVDGQIYGQPLFVSDVEYQGRTIDMVIVTTMKNSVYAFEAPAPDSYRQPSKRFLWHIGSDQLGTPLHFDYLPMHWWILGHNIQPSIGIVATPVVDKSRGTIFVTAKVLRPGGRIEGDADYTLNAIDLLKGTLKNRVRIEASFSDAKGSSARFQARFQLQRASLLEANDRIYLAFASHQDTRPYHGWVLAYDADSLQLVATYCSTCGNVRADKCDGSCLGGIWQAGGGPASDREGNVYVITGNGSFNTKVHDLSTSFIKLDKDLKPLGSWTPANFDCLNRTDADLGSAGPLLLEDGNLLVGGGKEGVLYAISTRRLTGTLIGGAKASVRGHSRGPCLRKDPTPDDGGVGEAYSAIQAAPLWQDSFVMDVLRLVEPAVLSQGFHHIHGGPVLWKARDDSKGDRNLVFVFAERDLLRAYEYNNGFVDWAVQGDRPRDTFHSRCKNSERGMPGGFLALSADGSDPASGIVWASMPQRDEDALSNIVPGVLRAYKAYSDTDTLEEIWNSVAGANPPTTCADDPHSAGDDYVDLFAKFVSPTVAKGKVYLATFSGRLVVFGLKQRPSNEVMIPQSYAATLRTEGLPKVAEPGRTLLVSVLAKNAGATTWQSSDGIRLVPGLMPSSRPDVAEQEFSPLTSDVPPGGTYTFSFKVKVPYDEAKYFYSWRLTRGASGKEQSEADGVGRGTVPQAVWALRARCSDLRSRATLLVNRISSLVATARLVKGDIHQLKADAERRNCKLVVDRMATADHSRSP